MSTKTNAIKTVEALKNENQDFEWYPTTKEIIKMSLGCLPMDSYHKPESILDCGAGDGRVLDAFDIDDKFYIEKSDILRRAINKAYSFIGKDFFTVNLMDKKVDAIFCNPPYSEYELWADKIIREGHTGDIILVIPSRWKDSKIISDALNYRGVTAKVAGNFDFNKADRAARANVDVVHISFKDYYKTYGSQCVDPFGTWFDTNFPFKEVQTPEEKEEEAVFNELVSGFSVVERRVAIYNKKRGHLSNAYKTLSEIPTDILSEIDVSKDSVKKSLQSNIKALKCESWRDMFKVYDPICKKLTLKSIAELTNRFSKGNNIDFTVDNIYIMTEWIIENANQYFDKQLVLAFEDMLNSASIKNYKSNKRVFKEENWYFNYEEVTHVMLEPRIILENQGGYKVKGNYLSSYTNGLGNKGATMLKDLIVVANNLGFSCTDTIETCTPWDELHKQDIMLDNGQVLMNAKVFKNGNMHLKLNQKFIRAINIEVGRIKGWVKDKSDVKEEMGGNDKEINEYFRANHAINISSVKKLLSSN